MKEANIKKWGGNVASWLFAVALALLLVLVLRSVAVQITPPPQPEQEPYPDVSTQELCEAEGGRWIENPSQVRNGDERPLSVDENIEAYCQGPLQFERERAIQDENSRQTSLFVFTLGGGIAIAAGIFLQTVRAVSPGLLLGGIASFFIAGIHVWTLAPGIGRLITIIVVFAVLLGIGLHVFKDDKKK